MFTNVMLSALISMSSMSYDTVKPQDKLFQFNSKMNYLQSISLIYTDIFDLTKKYKNKINIDNEGITHVSEERNPIANAYWNNNLWELGYLSAIGVEYIFINTFDTIDESGVASYAVTLLINISEIIVSSHWIDTFKLNKNVYTTVFTYQF